MDEYRRQFKHVAATPRHRLSELAYTYTEICHMLSQMDELDKEIVGLVISRRGHYFEIYCDNEKKMRKLCQLGLHDVPNALTLPLEPLVETEMDVEFNNVPIRVDLDCLENFCEIGNLKILSSHRRETSYKNMLFPTGDVTICCRILPGFETLPEYLKILGGRIIGIRHKNQIKSDAKQNNQRNAPRKLMELDRQSNDATKFVAAMQPPANVPSGKKDLPAKPPGPPEHPGDPPKMPTDAWHSAGNPQQVNIYVTNMAPETTVQQLRLATGTNITRKGMKNVQFKHHNSKLGYVLVTALPEFVESFLKLNGEDMNGRPLQVSTTPTDFDNIFNNNNLHEEKSADTAATAVATPPTDQVNPPANDTQEAQSSQAVPAAPENTAAPILSTSTPSDEGSTTTPTNPALAPPEPTVDTEDEYGSCNDGGREADVESDMEIDPNPLPPVNPYT